MTDFLLVHGAGQGAWTWGQVWGYLTAPVEHPPRLYSPRVANRVFTLDLPGHGADANVFGLGSGPFDKLRTNGEEATHRSWRIRGTPYPRGDLEIGQVTKNELADWGN